MKASLFCYGTLQAKEIIDTITGLSLQGSPATLQGFGCYRVKKAVFPGILPEAQGQVVGTFYTGLHGQALQRLDAFEGELYLRQQVTIINDKRQPTSAWAYVIKQHCRHLLTREPWYYEDYEDRFLARFRNMRNV